jgi:transcriptional regulator with XRE-family HTH domain
VSQEALADIAGVHRTFVSEVERGLRSLSLDNIEKLAKALNVDPLELFRP